MVPRAYTHLDDMLASQYQSIYWTQHATCQLGSLLVSGTMHEKTQVAE